MPVSLKKGERFSPENRKGVLLKRAVLEEGLKLWAPGLVRGMESPSGLSDEDIALLAMEMVPGHLFVPLGGGEFWVVEVPKRIGREPGKD
jgi:hypothetical protein